MNIELKIQEMSLDGIPLDCPDCGTSALTLDGRGPISALASVWATCSNYHSWEHQMLTMGDLEAIQAASTGRRRAEDEDTFQIVIGGAVLAGTLHPELTADDIKTAGGAAWRKLVKPALRKRKKQAVRAITRPVKKAGGDAVAHAKAAAIGAAWGLQAGGHQPAPDYKPEPVNVCPAGCDEGYFNIKSRVHGATRIHCSVCFGTGEID